MNLIEQFEKARLKYLPKKVKCLFIAEAPPDNLGRFFYYEDVREHDYLFLGIIELLYPTLKIEYLESGRDDSIKKEILQKFQRDGNFLLDLSELPKSMTNDLNSQTLQLIQRVRKIAESNTKIILIKVNVFDVAFEKLKKAGFSNVVDIRIPFPSSGRQTEFFLKCKEALDL